MEIIPVIVGPLETNCYIVTKNNQTIIIDPGEDYEKIQSICKDKNVTSIYVTHHHFDHVGALSKLEDYYQLKHNEFRDKSMKVIKTPGHSNDSLSFYFPEEKILFSGDFIFYHTIGRWDLESGSMLEMKESIKHILTYPKDITIYPGHGIPTTLKEEIKYLKQYI